MENREGFITCSAQSHYLIVVNWTHENIFKSKSKIITPMSNILHCHYHVLFVMFLAPSHATNFCSYSPVIVHTTQCQNHVSCCVGILTVNVIHMSTKMDECNICLKKFQSHSKKVTCCICSNGYHMKCITLCPDYTPKLTEEMNNWYCPTCLSCLFQYNLITDENDLHDHDHDFTVIGLSETWLNDDDSD